MATTTRKSIRGEKSMRRQIAANRASTTFELRYNLFRRKGQLDLCCAVPEDRPVPSFVTGERWDFAGTWDGVVPAPGLNRRAAEFGVRLNGFHLFQLAGPLGSRGRSEDPVRHAVCSDPARDAELELRLDDGRRVLLLFSSAVLRDATGAAIGAVSTVVDITGSTEPEAPAVPGPEALFGLRKHAKDTAVYRSPDER
jgi:PAS fold